MRQSERALNNQIKAPLPTMSLVSTADLLPGGPRLRVIVSDDEYELSVALEDALETIDPARVRVVRTGNLLRSAFSLRRLLVQVGNAHQQFVETSADRLTDAQIRSVLFAPKSGEAGIVLLVEQAHTLTTEACWFVWTLSRSQGRGELEPTVVLAGSTALWATLENAIGADEVQSLRQNRAGSAPIETVSEKPPLTSPSRKAGRFGRAGVLVSVALLAGSLAALAWARWTNPAYLAAAPLGPRSATAVARSAVPDVAAIPPALEAPGQRNPPQTSVTMHPLPTEPAQPGPLIPGPAEAPAMSAEPPSSGPAPARIESVLSQDTSSPVDPATPGTPGPTSSPESIARLQRRFDTFLTQSSTGLPQLTPPARQRLFEEYLASRSR